ncbi:MAG: 4Fe-4S binding protein [Chloroflexi bacterium]|jgi:iron only hydrogenase large subunit-like protein|nr:4Fe-4S binding protein [Chloroflexota bacterium]
MTDWVISTNVARCRDCYRCIRTCPVKAVRFRDGQAQVIPELCIACGNCVRVCPQNAKVVRDDRLAVRRAIRAGRTVVASVAPSIPAFFDIEVFEQIESALKMLGFAGAGETAYGAEMVGLAHKEAVEREPERWPVITSSCPVVVNLIEQYYPDLIPHLAPLVSPMIAHGRSLRQEYGEDAFVVFIGPCIAKKGEILDENVGNVIDAALTFAELREWMDAEHVALPACEQPRERAPRANARVFPVEGGLVGTATMDTDILSSQIVTTSGIEACEDVLRGIRLGLLDACMVELMACEGGCINGPAMKGQGSVFLARQRVLQYASRRQQAPLPTREQWPALDRAYADRSQPAPEFTEEQIREVLHRVDKHTPKDELNCGACGYPTCREKAIATLRGMAEATMCIPYMRRRAESLRQVVMDVTPNAVIIVDSRLYIQDMSPSAEAMFKTQLSAVVGMPLQTVYPVIDSFSQVRNTRQPVTNERVQLRDDLIVEQTIVPVNGEHLLVAILRDVTEREQQRDELDRLRTETLSHTREVVKNQMRVAHEIAQLLGESTAETKMMLSRLAKLIEEGHGQ